MRQRLTLMVVLFAIALLAAPSAMAMGPFGSGKTAFYHYFYSWLRDDDGDGIPNCKDPDYIRPEDGTGYGKGGDGEGNEVMNKYQYGHRNGDGEWYLYRYSYQRGDCTGECTRSCKGIARRGR